MLLYWSLTWHTSARNQNTLKIPKGQPEDVNQRTGNIISKQYNKAQQKSTKHYTKNWRLNNAKNQWWTQLLQKDSRRVVLFNSGDKTWKGLRRTRLWLRQTEINLKYPWSCVTHDIATVSEKKMATVCSDYRNVLLMESSQWENWNHLFCDAVSFHPVPRCWSRYKTDLLVSVVSFILC